MARIYNRNNLFIFSIQTLKPSVWFVFLSVIFGCLGGYCLTIVFTTISELIVQPKGAFIFIALKFISYSSLSIIFGLISSVSNVTIAQNVTAKIQSEILSYVIDAPLRQIELHKNSKIMSIINNDVFTIANFIAACSSYTSAIGLLFGILAYSLSNSYLIFFSSVFLFVINFTISFYSKKIWSKEFANAREKQDGLQKYIRCVVDGAVELKLNSGRRIYILHGCIIRILSEIKALKVNAITVFSRYNALCSLVFYVNIGIMIFLSYCYEVNSEHLSASVALLIYAKSPLDQLQNSILLLGQARVSIDRVFDFLSQNSPECELIQNNQHFPHISRQCVRSIQLEMITYKYLFSGQNFSMGPINFQINRGEILFIAGPNGSGKTTLLKTILGLYKPHDGNIYLDGQRVDENNIETYRQNFSAVLSDFYLLDDLNYHSRDDVLVNKFIEKLGLNNVTSSRGGVLSNINLSSGQRKRLALLNVFLEDRPIFVADEWASDQDPEFRNEFYTKILIELKSLNKAVVIVTHDKDYFFVADKVIYLRHGGEVN